MHQAMFRRRPYINSAVGVVLLLSCTAAMTQAATWYVSPSGNDTNPGMTAALPFKTIQTAVNNSSSGDTVILENGTYTGPNDVDVTFNGTLLTIQSQNGPLKTIINCNGSSSTYHTAFTYSNIGNFGTPALIEGITIENAYNPGYTSTCAINLSDSEVTIENCDFEDNLVGSINADSQSELTVQDCGFSGDDGVSANGTSTFTNCTFSTNDNNSALDIDGTSTISGCKFSDNEYTALYVQDGTATVTDTSFTNNSNAMYIQFGSATLMNCSFTGSTNEAIDNNNGGLTATSCNFSGNACPNNGGAIYVNNASTATSITDCVFSGNSGQTGGATYFNNDAPTLTNCVFTGNAAKGTSGNGGGIYNNSGTLTVQFCSFSGNTAVSTGGAMYNNNNGTAELVDDIYWGDIAPSSAEIGNGSGAVTANYCDIEDGFSGTANIKKDPDYVDATQGNLHLEIGSPCTGAGTPIPGVTTDLDGTTRPDIPTIGAYEGPPPVPTAPTDVSATAGHNAVTLSWTASANATSYNVFRSTTSGSEGTTPYRTTLSQTRYTDIGLTNGTTYYYTVAAVDISGTSGQSAQVSATPEPPVPNAPAGLKAVAGYRLVTLTWAGSSSATSYVVFRGTASDSESMTPIATGLTTTAYTNTGLTNGTVYYYKVAAVNPGGTSGHSNEAAAMPMNPPFAPTGLKALATDAYVALSWSPAATAMSYAINRSTASGKETSYKTDITVTSFTDTGITVGVTYYYTVSALNAGGQSPASNQVVSTPLAASATFVGRNTKAQGSWKGVFGADGYDLIGDTEARNPSWPSYATLTEAGATTGVWTTASTAAYALQAVASGSTNRLAGYGSSTSSFTINVNIRDGHSHQIALYLLDWAYAGRGETISVTDIGKKTVLSSEPASQFGAGVYYVWTIKGNVSFTVTRSAGGSAVLSALMFGAGSGSPAPATPAGLKASAGYKMDTLVWSASPDAKSYDLFRATATGVEGPKPFVSGLTSTTYTDTSVTPGKTYYYQVMAINDTGGSPASAEVSAQPLGSTAAFVKVDVTTEGSWKGVYGGDGYAVIGDTTAGNPHFPAYAGVTASGKTTILWSAGSTAAYVLQSAAVGSTNRVGGAWFAQSSFSVGVNLTDGNVHQVALYVQDWASLGRTETITVWDAATHAVLSTETASKFATGRYYIWSLKGNVTITIKNAGGANVVLSGLFFGAGNGQTAPSIPAGVSAKTGSSADSITLTWSESPGATSYNIYRSSTAGTEGATPYQTGVATPGFSDTGLTAGSTYYYNVMAVNAVGGSGCSAEVSATVPAAAGAPAP